jgi:peptide/nickel transport system substrate-binding protein
VTPLQFIFRMALMAAVLTAAPASKELRFAIPGEPRSFDPLHIEESNSEIVKYLTAGVLVRVNRSTDQLQPELAESWALTEGGRVLTFHLRDGLKFSDGSAFSTADVARMLNRALDPREASPAGDSIRAADGNPEVRVISTRDISIRYKSPRPGLDRLFDGLGIAPPDAAKSGRIGAGPYFIAEYKRGDFIRLQRNANYWKKDSAGGPLPYLDSVRLDIQQNRDIELARFLRGELHLINPVSPDNYARLTKERPVEAKNLGASLDSEFLWFNQSPAKTLPEWKRQWFRSSAFRHAVSRVLHRDDVVRIVYGGNAHVAAGPISPANTFWFNKELKPLPTDVAGALKLLNAEGFVLSGGVLRDRSGHPVEFSLITNAGNRSRERMAQLVQADLSKIGIKVNFVPLEMGSMLERIGKTLDYEAALLGFANVELDPLEERNVWLSSGAQHAWWPSQKSPATPWEARIDELELRQAAEGSRAARKKATDEIQRLVVAEEPIIYLVNPDYLCAIAPALRGLQPAVSPPQLLWNVEWLRLE